MPLPTAKDIINIRKSCAKKGLICGHGIPDASTPIDSPYLDVTTGCVYSFYNGAWVNCGAGETIETENITVSGSPQCKNGTISNSAPFDTGIEADENTKFQVFAPGFLDPNGATVGYTSSTASGSLVITATGIPKTCPIYVFAWNEQTICVIKKS